MKGLLYHRYNVRSAGILLVFACATAYVLFITPVADSSALTFDIVGKGEQIKAHAVSIERFLSVVVELVYKAFFLTA